MKKKVVKLERVSFGDQFSACSKKAKQQSTPKGVHIRSAKNKVVETAGSLNQQNLLTDLVLVPSPPLIIIIEIMKNKNDDNKRNIAFPIGHEINNVPIYPAHSSIGRSHLPPFLWHF